MPWPSLHQKRTRRDRALIELDMDWARSELPYMQTDEARLVCLHKVRVECVTIDAQFRLESIEWLRERGYRRMGRLPLPLPGVLPT